MEEEKQNLEKELNIFVNKYNIDEINILIDNLWNKKSVKVRVK